MEGYDNEFLEEDNIDPNPKCNMCKGSGFIISKDGDWMKCFCNKENMKERYYD